VGHLTLDVHTKQFKEVGGTKVSHFRWRRKQQPNTKDAYERQCHSAQPSILQINSGNSKERMQKRTLGTCLPEPLSGRSPQNLLADNEKAESVLRPMNYFAPALRALVVRRR